jgi:hypothetical protein
VWPDQPYAAARGSFERPVPLPLTEPTDSPKLTVQVNCSWLPYIRGALQQLLLQATWSTDDPAALLLAQQRVFNLIDLFGECSGGGFAFACPYDFALHGAAIWACLTDVSSTPECVSDFVVGSGFEGVEFTNTGVPGRTFGWAQCHALFTATTLTTVEMSYDVLKGSFDVDDGGQTGIFLRLAGTVVASQVVNSASDGDGVGKSVGWVGSITADEIIFRVEMCNRTSGTMSGSARINGGIVEGTGSSPCGFE